MSERRRPATRTDHENFCITEGWAERKRATGKRGTHHVNYEFALPDGRILYTRISHPVDRTGYGPSIWSHILRDQLAVTAEEFWACVEDKVLPDRQELQVPAETIPVGVVRVLDRRGTHPGSSGAGDDQGRSHPAPRRLLHHGSIVITFKVVDDKLTP